LERAWEGNEDVAVPFQMLVAYQNADSKVPEKVRNALQDAPLKV
jgi:osmotically-inducible protein OsmY